MTLAKINEALRDHVGPILQHSIDAYRADPDAGPLGALARGASLHGARRLVDSAHESVASAGQSPLGAALDAGAKIVTAATLRSATENLVRSSNRQKGRRHP
ncbi:MAG TPA: hypothetical protein VEW42_03110 [Candidatus Eisenbacteria bacterium]|nr:hypothetical protein [Candidatus Eisenbacteria bacterium]